MPPKPTALVYVGKGAFVSNVPARDLSADEAAQFDINSLLKSGLYVVAPLAKEK